MGKKNPPVNTPIRVLQINRKDKWSCLTGLTWSQPWKHGRSPMSCHSQDGKVGRPVVRCSIRVRPKPPELQGLRTEGYQCPNPKRVEKRKKLSK